MKNLLSRLWSETSGVLSFEWITLNSVVALGVVGGISTVRDALVDEMADLAEAMTSLDQSYTIAPPKRISVGNNGGQSGSMDMGYGSSQYSLQTGSGYSRAQWNELLKTHPELEGQYGVQTESSGVGSRYLDRKPKIDREGDAPEKPANLMDPIIDDTIAPKPNKQ